MKCLILSFMRSGQGRGWEKLRRLCKDTVLGRVILETGPETQVSWRMLCKGARKAKLDKEKYKLHCSCN